MVDRAEREAVDHGSNSCGVRVLDYVRRLDESGLSQSTNGAALPVRAQDITPEALLVETKLDFPERVLAEVGRRDHALSTHVFVREADFEKHGPRGGIVVRYEDGLRDDVLAGRDAEEIDKWD